MNRDEFITKQIKKFGCFNANNMEIWMKDYQSVLTEPYIDFERLDMKIIRDWDSTFNAPSTKWLKLHIQDCLKEEAKKLCPALVETRTMKEQAEPPSEDCRQRVAEIKQKLARMKIAQ